jgi:hypothetical protein
MGGDDQRGDAARTGGDGEGVVAGQDDASGLFGQEGGNQFGAALLVGTDCGR